MKNRKLFCQISPTTYKIAVFKCIMVRKLKNLAIHNKIANKKTENNLPISIYKHKSLIRRKLGNVDIQLQENKAINLKLATAKVNKITIGCGEIFSFWSLVGSCTEKKGYKNGLTISSGKTTSGIGGGMCQFTNLIHWMILHTDMEIVEHHHHDQIDLFPDYNRQIPFGTGTSIVYNYLDYRFINNTNNVYQLITYTDDTYLCGEIRSDNYQKFKYHIKSENEFFTKENDEVFRNGKVYRNKIDKETGIVIEKKLIRDNHAKVMYDTDNIDLIIDNLKSI